VGIDYTATSTYTLSCVGLGKEADVRKCLFFLATLACAQTAKYPGAIATDADLFKAKDRSASTLTSNIDASTLSIPVADGTRFVAYEVITIDSEQMVVCSVAGNTLTICTGTRGFDWTDPATHNKGAAVRGQITAWHHNAMSEEVKAVETALGVNLGNVVLPSRTISTTAPLGGGGDLSANRTLTCTTCEVTTNKNAANGYAGLDASARVSLARGGTAADLSATGGANQFLKQSSPGAAVTVGTISDADVPDTITLTNITQITNRSHTSLADIGTNTHAQIDTHIAATSAHSATDAATANRIVLRDANAAAIVYDKGGAAYNVKAYGAKGDGSTDDRAAIQAAINAAASSGGVVYFPAGTYYLSSGLSTTSNKVTFLGANSSAVVLKMMSATGDTLAITADNAYVYGLSFWPGVNRTSGAELHVKNVGIGGVIKDIIIRGATYKPYNGIFLENTNTISLMDAIVYDATGTAAVYLKCSTDSPSSCGAMLDRVTAGGGTSSLLIQASTGKAFAGTTIANSGFGSGSSYGIWLDPNGGIVNEVFANNIMVGSYSSRGIYLYGGSGTGAGHKFNNVYIGSSTTGVTAGIEILSMFKWIELTNIQHAGKGNAIVIRGADNVRIANSSISCNGESGQIGVFVADDANNAAVNVTIQDSVVGYHVDGSTTGQVCGDGVNIVSTIASQVLLTGVRSYGSATGLSLSGGGTSATVKILNSWFENTSKPSCSVMLRSSTWTTESGAGVSDAYEVCRKDASNNYAWAGVY
jgi:hypothetical protein